MVRTVKLILAVLCLVAGMVAIACAEDRAVPFEDLHIKQALPDYCYAMPRPLYEKWAQLQNEGAYRKAQRLADAARLRRPYGETFQQDSDYAATVTQNQKEKLTPDSASMSGVQDTKYKGKNTQRAYKHDDIYSGGPVVVINPYAPRPAAILFKDDGTPFVSDPDRTLLYWQAKRMLNEYLRAEEDRRFIDNPPYGGEN